VAKPWHGDIVLSKVARRETIDIPQLLITLPSLMPLYEYECQACGHRLEAQQKLADAPLTKCPECGKEQLQKLISATSFTLKGGGWYKDLYSSAKPGSEGASSSSAPSSESKPAANSTEKADKSDKGGGESKSSGDSKPAASSSPASSPSPSTGSTPSKT
jgi:putative FmdB family regulatory protein